jgi:hypothetical protein
MYCVSRINAIIELFLKMYKQEMIIMRYVTFLHITLQLRNNKKNM